MKRYFLNTDESCYPELYFHNYMRANNLTEIEVYKAMMEKGGGYFYCTINDACGDVSQGECGKICNDYSPRNGKNGRCRHSRNTYDYGEKTILKLKAMSITELRDKYQLDYGPIEEIRVSQVISDLNALIQSEGKERKELLNNEFLCELLEQVAKWVKQENSFKPLEYTGILKEWIINRFLESENK